MYITIAARYFTPSVHLVAVVGSDFPDEYIDMMRDSGVDLSGLEVDRLGKTFAWSGRYHDDLNIRDTLATHLNVLETFSPKVPKHLRRCRIVCLGNLDPNIQCQVLDQMSNPEFIICDTMNFWIENERDALTRILGRIDCLIVNDSEARDLAGDANLIRAARMIRNMGPEIVVIKKGEHGALLFTENAVFSVPAYPVEDIQDPTGAGDAFMGGFAGCLSDQQPHDLNALKTALVCGCAIASFTVEKFGPERLLGLEKSDVLSRIQAFRDLTTIPLVEEIL